MKCTEGCTCGRHRAWNKGRSKYAGPCLAGCGEPRAKHGDHTLRTCGNLICVNALKRRTWTGRKHTPESRAKISASKRGRGKPRGGRPLVDRFWSKVDVREPDECWMWLGSPSNRYGTIWRLETQTHDGAHRVAWELANGRAVPDGMEVCHTCDTPKCVNARHLFIGTTRDNAHDREAKGRGTVAYLNHGNPAVVKLSETDVRAIRKMYATGEYLQREIACVFGINKSHVSRIIRFEMWPNVA